MAVRCMLKYSIQTFAYQNKQWEEFKHKFAMATEGQGEQLWLE